MTQVKWRDYSREFPAALRANTSDLRDNLSLWIERASHARVAITRHGIVVGELSIPTDCTSFLSREKREHHSEVELAAQLTEAGFLVRRQVRLACGRADIVVYVGGDPWAVIELKLVIESEMDRTRAVKQVTRYANELGAPFKFVAALKVSGSFDANYAGTRICPISRLSDALAKAAS